MTPSTIPVGVVVGVIYKATCVKNKKVYIGQTIRSFVDRYKKHINSIEDERSPSYYTKFSNALRKHGVENFQWEILHKDVPWDKLDDLEIQEIKNHNSYHSGYNSTKGGNIGAKNAKTAQRRYEKYLMKKDIEKAKKNAKEQKRKLTNFEKGAKKTLRDFLKKEDTKENEEKRIKLSIKRSISAKQKHKNNLPDSSEYIGVCWDKQHNKWKASIKINGKKKHLGLFSDEIEAAKAYDKVACTLGRKINLEGG